MHLGSESRPVLFEYFQLIQGRLVFLCISIVFCKSFGKIVVTGKVLFGTKKEKVVHPVVQHCLQGGDFREIDGSGWQTAF